MNSNLFLVFFSLVLGLLLRRTGKFPESSAKTLNAFVVWVSLPALIFTLPPFFAKTSLEASLFWPLLMPWLQFLLAAAFFYFWGQRRGWSQRRTGALILGAGLGNTSFVALPLLSSILGEESYGVAILIDQGGSFLVLSTLGILVAAALSPRTQKIEARTILKSVITFPPFLALVASLGLVLLGGQLPEILSLTFARLAQTLVPLALVAVGLQLQVSRPLLQRQWKTLALGLVFKLLLMPLFFWALYRGLLGKNDFSTHVTLLQAAMAPMITAAVVAEDFDLEAEICALMLGVGIPLSLITVPLWHRFFSHF